MAVTQRQIAAKLGLTQASVALALNGRPGVGEETRQRVLAAAREMGYRNSNSAARAMAARRHGQRPVTGVIGCVLPTVSSGVQVPYILHVLEGVRQVCARNSIELMLLHELPEHGDGLDGLLCCGGSADVLPTHAPYEFPVVSLFTGTALPAVVADDRTGLRLAVDHLIGLGHRRIAYLVYPKPDISRAVSERVATYHEVLRAAGIEPDPTWIGHLYHQPENDMLDSGRSSMERWLNEGWRELGCTAMLVQNDRAAIGAMSVLQAAGIRVPEDVSVIGFDGTDECEVCSPRLTSVRVPVVEISVAATELLLRAISEDDAPKFRMTFPTEFQKRDSTAAPVK